MQIAGHRWAVLRHPAGLQMDTNQTDPCVNRRWLQFDEMVNANLAFNESRLLFFQFATKKL